MVKFTLYLADKSKDKVLKKARRAFKKDRCVSLVFHGLSLDDEAKALKDVVELLSKKSKAPVSYYCSNGNEFLFFLGNDESVAVSASISSMFGQKGVEALKKYDFESKVLDDEQRLADETAAANDVHVIK